MSIKLVGITGPAQSGKSTLGTYLEQLLSYETYALAEPIKQMICTLFDWTAHHADGHLKEVVVDVDVNRLGFVKAWIELGMTKVTGKSMTDEIFLDLMNLLFPDNNLAISPRKAFQLFGTEFVRGFNSNAWLDLAEIKLAKTVKTHGLIITDIRFPNEHKWIHDHKGLTIHVRRKESGYKIAESDHDSEAGLKKASVDWATPVCSNLEELERASKTLASYIAVAPESDVKLSGRMPTFETLYEGRLS